MLRPMTQEALIVHRPVDRPQQLILLFHGLGADEHDLRPVGERLAAEYPQALVVSVRADGQRRLYRLEPAPLQQVDAWMARFRGVWEARLDALATEIARGKRQRRRSTGAPATSTARRRARGS